MPATIAQQNTGTANSGSLTATLGAGTTTGRTLLIAVQVDGTPTQPSGFATDLTQDNATFGRMRLYRKAAAAGETSWGITISGGNGGAWCALEVSGLLASPLDKTATATGTSAAPSTGTTANTAQADEWALAVLGAAVSSSTPSFSAWTNSFVEIADFGSSGGTWKHSLGLATRDLNAIGAYTAGATLTPNTFWSAGIVTYQLVPSVALPTTRPVDRIRHLLVR